MKSLSLQPVAGIARKRERSVEILVAVAVAEHPGDAQPMVVVRSPCSGVARCPRGLDSSATRPTPRP